MKAQCKIFAAFVMVLSLLVGSLALADETKKPVGTVSIDETQIAVILGGLFGGGPDFLYLKNQNGVVMKLKGGGFGVQLNVASASGVKVEMK